MLLLDNYIMSNIAIALLDKELKVPLSVQFIARYLQAGKTPSEISRIANVSRQAVSDYIKRHYDLLSPLLADDQTLAMLSKEISIKAQSNIEKALDKLTLKESKKSLVALNAISGTHIDKYRLLSGQSTEGLGQSFTNFTVNNYIVNNPDNKDKNCKDITPKDDK